MILSHLFPLEYATVGYVEKRIRLRKTQFQMIQKMAEKKRAAAAVLSESEVDHTPRQTVGHLIRYWGRESSALVFIQ